MDMQIVEIYQMRKTVIKVTYVRILKENSNVKILMKIINAFQNQNNAMAMMIVEMEVMKKAANAIAQIPLVAQKYANASIKREYAIQ